MISEVESEQLGGPGGTSCADCNVACRVRRVLGLAMVLAAAIWQTIRGLSCHPCAKPLFQRSHSGGVIRCHPRRRAGFCLGGKRTRMGSVSTTSAVSIASVMSTHSVAASDRGAPSGAMKP